MDASQIAANVGAAITLGLGGLGFFAPARAAAVTSLSPIGPDGVSEIRATYGGLFAALGLFCLVSQSDLIFTVVGVGWVGIALGRAGSVLIDRNFRPRNFGAIAFELVIGLLLLAAR